MVGTAAQERDRDRLAVFMAVIMLHALIGYALITALAIEFPAKVTDQLKLFTVTLEPPARPAEKPARQPARPAKASAAAAPPNLKAKPSEVVTPPPELPLIVPPPIVVAPIAGLGSNPSAGASDVPGPGTGSGGQGTGTGSGGNGGDAEGDGDYSPPRWLRGRIRDSDYPHESGESGVGQTITLRFTVEANGQVTGCTILQSSGNAILDDATCRLVERRYRYEPSRDASGTAVLSQVVEDHVWRRRGH